MIAKIILSAIVLLIFFSACNSGTSLKGDIIFEAYYQGTQSQSCLYLNNKGDYENHHSGVFFMSERYTGKYTRVRDTLFLEAGSKSSRFFSDTMIIKHDSLFAHREDTIIYSHYKIKN